MHKVVRHSNYFFQSFHIYQAEQIKKGVICVQIFVRNRGWSGGVMVLCKLPVPERPTIWITVGQGPIALAVGAGGGCMDIFSLVYHFSFFTLTLWETARYGLKYCLKGPLSPKTTNQPLLEIHLTEHGRFHFQGGVVGWCDGPGPSQGGTFVLALHGCLLSICVWYVSIVATCIAVHFAVCHALYNNKNKKIGKNRC